MRKEKGKENVIFHYDRGERERKENCVIEVFHFGLLFFFSPPNWEENEKEVTLRVIYKISVNFPIFHFYILRV